MTDDWGLIGFVIASRYRKIIPDKLSDHPSTPSQITRQTDTRMASISYALSQLEVRDYVERLVNEDRRKGRVYGLTDTGNKSGNSSVNSNIWNNHLSAPPGLRFWDSWTITRIKYSELPVRISSNVVPVN